MPSIQYDIKVLGTTSPEIKGCAAKKSDHNYHGFDLWLGEVEGSEMSCGDDDNLDHYSFECVSTWEPSIKHDKKNWHYVSLYDSLAYENNRPSYRCAIYETSNNITFRVAISGHADCHGLIERSTKPDIADILDDNSWWDGMIIMEWSRNVRRVKKVINNADLPPQRSKRETKEGCRFPEWSQGKWTDLTIEGGRANYAYAFYVENLDEVNGNNGKKRLVGENENGNSETALLTRVRRHASVPINDHRPRFDRTRRSLNSTLFIRKPTTPVPIDPLLDPYIHMINDYKKIIDKSTIVDSVLELFQLRSKRQLDVTKREELFRLLPQEGENKKKKEFNVDFFPAGPTPPPSPPLTPPNTPPRKPLPNNKMKKTFEIPTQIKNVLNVRNRKKRSNSINGDTMTPPPQTPLLLVSALEDDNKKESKHSDLIKRKENTNLGFYRNIYADGNHDLTWMTPFNSRKQKNTFINTQDKKPIETTPNNYVKFPWYTFKDDRHFVVNKKLSLVKDNQKENRNKRSVDENQQYDDEEAALEQIKIAEEERKNIFDKWWSEFQENAMIEYQNRWSLAKGIKNENYDKYPERKPVPSPIEFLKLSEKKGVPYKEAVIQWREMERAHRMWRAEVEYIVYPNRNSPGVVIDDFDMTYKDIEYDFNPQYPEGTSKDPTAYRVQTLPGGFKLAARQSRRNAWNEKQLRAASEETVPTNPHEGNFIFGGTSNNFFDENDLKGNRRKRSYDPKHFPLSHYTWRCVLEVDSAKSQTQDVGVKFLTMGGEIIAGRIPTEPHHIEENKSEKIFTSDSNMIYNCVQMISRGPNIIEIAVIGSGIPKNKSEDMQKFAQFLCTDRASRDAEMRAKHGLRPHYKNWITEIRPEENIRVPVACPVQPGTEFYGVVPAPPPPSKAALNAAAAASIPNIDMTPTATLQLCARLISSANDCENGQSDRMRYTVSECIDQDAATAGTLPKVQTVFEATRGRDSDRGAGRRRNKRDSSDVRAIDTLTPPLTITSPKYTTSDTATSSPSMNSTNYTSPKDTTSTSSATTSPPTTASTTASLMSTSTTTSTSTLTSTSTTSTNDRSIGTTSTATTASSTTMSPPSTLPVTSQWPQQSVTSGTTASHYSTTSAPPGAANDYYYRQQQRPWQHQQHPNYHNGYPGQQQYSPPPVSTGADYNSYYYQQQQQQWQQRQQQWQHEPRQTNDYYNNGRQQTAAVGGGRRTEDDYYNYRQQPSGAIGGWRNSPPSTAPNGSWNVHGDRPLYVSSVTDNDRDLPLLWNSTTGGGGWTTAAQQHWAYQQQQRQQQHYNRGILSLPPVPLPPLHADQTVLAGSTTPPPTLPPPPPPAPPARPRQRPQKPPNHYYQPTQTTNAVPPRYRLRSKSESRYYQEREYQCLGQWSEEQPQANATTGSKPVIFTYTYVKRLDPVGSDVSEFECFVGTSIPNDDDKSTDTTATLLLTEAGTGNKCSRWADPHKSGMKLVGTTTSVPSSCAGYKRPSWYPLKPSDNGGGKWIAAGPVPIRNGVSTPRQQGHQQQPGAPPKQDSSDASILGSLLPQTILMVSLVVAANRHSF